MKLMPFIHITLHHRTHSTIVAIWLRMSSQTYGTTVKIELHELKSGIIKGSMHPPLILRRSIINLPLGKHGDVCPAMRTRGLYRLAMWLVRETGVFQGRK